MATLKAIFFNFVGCLWRGRSPRQELRILSVAVLVKHRVDIGVFWAQTTDRIDDITFLSAFLFCSQY